MKLNKQQKREVIAAFWAAVEKRELTWEDLNRGSRITFTWEGRRYTTTTYLGNFTRMNIAEFAKRCEKTAVLMVESAEQRRK